MTWILMVPWSSVVTTMDVIMVCLCWLIQVDFARLQWIESTLPLAFFPPFLRLFVGKRKAFCKTEKVKEAAGYKRIGKRPSVMHLTFQLFIEQKIGKFMGVLWEDYMKILIFDCWYLSRMSVKYHQKFNISTTEQALFISWNSYGRDCIMYYKFTTATTAR